MIASDWQQIREVFEQSLSIPEVERSRFLDQVCQRIEIRLEVERLLRAECELSESSFLNKPIWEWEEMESTQQAQTIELPFTDTDKNKYRILKEIGHGGMGVVYLAFSSEREAEVAIKVMRDGFSKEDIRRFDDERRIHVKLDDNQHMVTLLGKGLLSDGRPYFVMKFINGESLESALKRGVLPIQKVVEITSQLANALSFAHRAGVVHRDIKPSNIMLSEVGGALCVKVLDFGIAILKDSDDLSTKDFTTKLICTPAYASPEQAEGKRRDQIDHRSDIFSLGCVVFEMLTGKRPFGEGSPHLLLSRRLTEKPASVSNARPDLGLSTAVDRVLAKAMERHPEGRYSDAQQFAIEFEKAMATEDATIVVSPLRKPVWQKYLFPVIAVLLLMVAGGAGLQYCDDSSLSVLMNESRANENAASSPNQASNNNENAALLTEPSSSEADSKGSAASESITERELNIKLLRQTSIGETSVPFETVFRRGDLVRWTVEAEKTGYLYIVFKGSSGNVAVFYPNQRESKSYAPVQKEDVVLFPKKGATLGFDGNAGVETYYFILASKKGEPSLAELERAISQKRTPLSETEGERLIEALQAGVKNREPGFCIRIIELQHR